jgi:crotonobetainyl-CoA:carnitine CoA-transferase CaiB-like acyl-CoA transferase
MLEFAAYGNVMPRSGNRSPHAAPQGVYACAGREQWLAISVANDDQWRSLVALVDDVRLEDESLAHADARHTRHDQIDEILAEWASTRDPRVAAALLRAKGVPAAECWDPRLLDQHPQFRARGLFGPVNHPVLGRYHAPGLPYRFDGVDQWVHTAAPAFGEHNREVLTHVLGLNDEAIESLVSTGVIAERPRGL